MRNIAPSNGHHTDRPREARPDKNADRVIPIERESGNQAFAEPPRKSFDRDYTIGPLPPPAAADSSSHTERPGEQRRSSNKGFENSPATDRRSQK
jgi:hypothetical protein